MGSGLGMSEVGSGAGAFEFCSTAKLGVSVLPEILSLIIISLLSTHHNETTCTCGAAATPRVGGCGAE